MRYALIEHSEVVQIDCNPREGFIEVEDNVSCGMLYDGKNFSLPASPPISIQSQIQALEAQQTPRILREAIEGQAFALSKLSEIEDAIQVLRAKL